MGKAKHTSEGLGTSWAFNGDDLVFSASSTSALAADNNSIKSEIKDTLNVQNTWTVKLPKKYASIGSKKKKNIREIQVPAVSAAVTVDTWRAFKDPTLVLRLKYLTCLWTNNDLWLYGICKVPDLTLLTSTAEILIFGTPRLPETEANISFDETS